MKPGIDYIGVGVGALLLLENKVLLGHRNDDAVKASSTLHGEGTWTMPGGKMRFGETFEGAVCREVLEETGIKINVGKLKLISVTNDFEGDVHFVTIGFLSKDFEGRATVLEPEEITEWKWFAFNALPEKIFSPSKKILEKYLGKFKVHLKGK